MLELQDMLLKASEQDFPVATVDRDIDLRDGTAFLPHLHHGLEIKLLGAFRSTGLNSIRLWQVEQAIVILPEVVHSSFDRDAAQRSVSILLENDEISCVCCTQMLTEAIPLTNLFAFGVSPLAISNFLQNLAKPQRQSSNWDRHTIMILKSLMTALVLYIETGKAPKESTPVTNAVNFIHRHYYRNKLSVEDIAAHAGMTSNYLSNIFRKKMGITIRQYLIQTRLEQAKILLEGGRCLVKDAARLTGWNSAYYFSNCYHEYFGEPPSKDKSNAASIVDSLPPQMTI